MFRPFFPVCHLGDLSSVFILTRSLHPCLILNHPSAISQSHKKDINYLFTVHVRPITEKTPSNRTCHFCWMPFCNVPCSIMSAHVSFYPCRPSSSVHVAPLTQQDTDTWLTVALSGDVLPIQLHEAILLFTLLNRQARLERWRGPPLTCFRSVKSFGPHSWDICMRSTFKSLN